MNTRTAALKRAFPLTLPVMAGYVFLGITYGVLMVSKGMPSFLPILTAAVVYTGSMEFLLTGILISSFNPAAAFITAIAVGSRHLFYGLSMLDKYKNTGWKKFYLIFTTSDETFAVNYVAKITEGVDRGWFYFWVSLLDQCYWVCGAALGTLAGNFITFNTKGLDFVMTAMFVTIFMNQWLQDSKKKEGFVRGHISEFVGILASAAALLVFGADYFIVPALFLAPAVFGFLVVYCLRNVEFTSGTFGIPELAGIAVTAISYWWKQNMMLSMALGTALYMFLVQAVFV